MIQPINSTTPQVSFRGTNRAYGRAPKLTSSNVALINAGGVSAAVGGLTMALSRGYTTNWAHAAVIGVCASFLSMFFMTPQIIEKSGKAKKVLSTDGEALVKEDAGRIAKTFSEHLKPFKKLIPFKQQQA